MYNLNVVTEALWTFCIFLWTFCIFCCVYSSMSSSIFSFLALCSSMNNIAKLNFFRLDGAPRIRDVWGSSATLLILTWSMITDVTCERNCCKLKNILNYIYIYQFYIQIYAYSKELWINWKKKNMKAALTDVGNKNKIKISVFYKYERLK